MEGTFFSVQVCTLRVCGTFLCYFSSQRCHLSDLDEEEAGETGKTFFTKKLSKESRVRAQYKFGFQTQRGNDWSIRAHGHQQVEGNQRAEINFFCFKSSACCSCGQGKNGTVNLKKKLENETKKMVDKYVNYPSLFLSAL